MRRRRLLAVSGALLAGAVAGCTESDSEGPSEDSEPNDPDPVGDRAPARALAALENEQLQELVAETNGFAVDLHRRVLADRADENLFSSPISASVALAMTCAGARGNTREQMRSALRYTVDDLHETMGELQRRLDERGASEGESDGERIGDGGDEGTPFQLSIANSVWGQQDYPFADGYRTTLAQQYGAELAEANFTEDPDGERARINDWVAEETAGTIEELLPPGSIDDLTRLVLVNAIYFLANWEQPFPEGRTEQATFTALDGTDHEVPLMGLEREWPYVERAGTRAVELPYVGGDAAMLVVLPPEGEFEAYERELDGDDLAELVNGLDTREGTVRLPRFEFDTSVQLSDPLAELGMPDAFDREQADFTGMAESDEGERLYLDEAYHDAAVAVDENGTEAAAATGAVIGDTAVPADPFEFVADRPFLFAIRDRPTGAVLFLGRVVDPSGWE